jgi:oligopeptide transport system substrate-binding protein
MKGLYHFDKNNRAKLAGATSVKVSNGNRVYTYNLRKNAKWSNGDPVTAQDYVTGWRRTVDPKNSSLDSDSYAIIKNGTKITQGKAKVNSLGIKALGKYRLQVTSSRNLVYNGPFTVKG